MTNPEVIAKGLEECNRRRSAPDARTENLMRAGRKLRRSFLFGTLLLLSFILALASYTYAVYRSVKPSRLDYSVTLVEAPSQDKVVAENPWLIPIVASLVRDGEATEKQGTTKAFRVYKITTPAFGEATSGHPIDAFTCQISYDHSRYNLVAHPWRVHPVAGGFSFTELKLTATDGVVEFTVPKSERGDRLLIVGRLDKRDDKKFPTGLGDAIKLELRK